MIRSKNRTPAQTLRSVLALVMALLLIGSVSVSAVEMDSVPYYSYTYWEGPSRYEAIPMRAMYEPVSELDADSLGLDKGFDSAQYVTLSQDHTELYILDSGNSRIVVVDTDTLEVLRIIGEINGDGETLNYTEAQGMYVDHNGDLYIADEQGKRVIIADADGNLIRVLDRSGLSAEKGVPDDLEYAPIRVIKDTKGYLYVASFGCYYGVLVYDNNLEFLGFHGSFKVQQSVSDTIVGWFESLFMTNEKAANQADKLSGDVLDIAIDPDGMLYTLTGGVDYGQIKRMGLNGNQTLNHKFGFTSQSGDLINFRESVGSIWYDHIQYVSSLTDITVDSDGYFYIMDSSRSRIFMYDEECRMLSAFTTGYGNGTQVGNFSTPTSLAVSGDKLFVLDSLRNIATVFKLTDYGALVKKADALTISGEYDEALPLWEQVVKLDGNNQRAYEGIGKAMLTTANQLQDDEGMDEARPYYERAMEYAEKGNDQQTYSQAYEEIQTEWISVNFWWLFLLCLALVGGIAALLVLSKKRKLFEIKNPQWRTALTVPLHPFQAFNSLKNQKTGSIPLALLFVVLFYLTTVSKDLYGGFMYVLTDTSTYNALYTLIGSVGILLLWVITNWGLCILNDGKGSLKEVFIMSSYSMAPMIVYAVVFTVITHVIPSTGTSTFSLLSTIVAIYMVLLMLIGMTVIHEYSFFKAMGMAVLSVLGMVLVAFVIFSVILLAQQFIMFGVALVEEALLR